MSRTKYFFPLNGWYFARICGSVYFCGSRSRKPKCCVSYALRTGWNLVYLLFFIFYSPSSVVWKFPDFRSYLMSADFSSAHAAVWTRLARHCSSLGSSSRASTGIPYNVGFRSILIIIMITSWSARRCLWIEKKRILQKKNCNKKFCL